MLVLRYFLTALGLLAWSAYIGRLLLRALHILQLEGYETRRYLRWSRQHRTTPEGAAAALAAAALDRGAAKDASSLAAAAAGAWLWRRATFPTAKKPLVLTARAKRLLGGQIALSAAALAIALARKPSLATLWAACGVLSLVTPVVTAASNLLLWPVEEAFRRYYLRDARRTLQSYQPTVVAVAGSYGKTSTKEFLAVILSRRWNVLRPPGSYNTPMGLSRVIREQLRPDHDVFVTELGDYVPGDIRFLCDLVRPRIGVLTTIGPEHLERFETMERVVQAKQELLDALPSDGIAIINQDDPLVRPLGDRAERRGLRVVRYGLHEPGAQVRASGVRTTREGLEFEVSAEGAGQATFRVGVLGKHNVSNILAATAAALQVGMRLSEIAAAAADIAPVEHRLQPIKGSGGVLIIDDAFNSNPRGAAEALEVLRELEGGRRVLVTPGMVELAEREFDENRVLGRRAAEVCDEVILVGADRAAPLLAGLRDGGFPENRTHVVRDLAAATARLQTTVGAGDIVLFENDLPDTYADHANGSTPTPTPTAQPSILSNATREVVVNGLRVAYAESGPDWAPVVVILHGWGASSAAVASIQHCLEADYHTIVPDLPGFGRSEPPPAVWGSPEYAACMRAFLEQLGVERATLAGHSLGGKVSIVLAATHPGVVERLVLIDSAGIRPRHGPMYQARVLAFKTARRLAPGQVQGWLERRVGSEDYQRAGSMRQTLVRMVNEDVRDLLPRVNVPTLLIWGELDDDTPVSDGQLMEQLIPDAGLVVFPGAGHFAYADDAGRFCRVATYFLKSPAA